jgi:choline-sulfatase
MKRLTRRDYLLGQTALAAAPGAGQPVDSSQSRPNVLWIMTDEHRPDSLGCFGSRWARTPNLDRVAQRGTVFHECHVQSPVCVPCRTSMLTGRYPQEINVYENSVAFKDGILDPSIKTFPELFAAAGYRTCSLGKWHTPNHPTWQKAVNFTLMPKVAGYYSLPAPYSEAEHHVIKRPGGTSIILGGIYPEANWGETLSGHLTDMAIDWLKGAAKSDQPFLLRVSHLWPHTPVLDPRPWDQLYAPGDVPCRANNRQAYQTRAQYDRRFADRQRGMDIPLETWRQICAYYYGLVAYVDHEVGRLLRALDELGLAEKTIVALNADHGKSLGEAGLCEKGTFDREVWRVPMIISWPGHIPEGEHRHDLVELIDFGPTICAQAGIAKAPGMHGRDLFHSREPEAVFGVIGLGVRRAAVRTKKYRFDCTVADDGGNVGFDRCDPNLFDLEADPFEERNLAQDPAHAAAVKEHYQRMQLWMRDPAAAYS